MSPSPADDSSHGCVRGAPWIGRGAGAGTGTSMPASAPTKESIPLASAGAILVASLAFCCACRSVMAALGLGGASLAVGSDAQVWPMRDAMSTPSSPQRRPAAARPSIRRRYGHPVAASRNREFEPAPGHRLAEFDAGDVNPLAPGVREGLDDHLLAIPRDEQRTPPLRPLAQYRVAPRLGKDHLRSGEAGVAGESHPPQLAEVGAAPVNASRHGSRRRRRLVRSDRARVAGHAGIDVCEGAAARFTGIRPAVAARP